MAKEKLLVAIDLTEDADEVLTTATELAGRYDAELSVLTVVRPLTYAYGRMDLVVAGDRTLSIEQAALKHARAALSALAEQHGVPPDRAHVLLGNPAEMIRALAETLDATLIVIGTHAKRGLGLFLGSTANAVLHGVKRDVLVVRLPR